MKTAKILIADHEETSLNHLGAVLQAARHQVALTRDGKEALAKVASFKPDVCVIDPMVTGIDGFTLSQRIRRQYPKVGIIIATAIYKGDRYRRDAISKYGASLYMEKPFSDQDFLNAVLNLAGIKTAAPPQPTKSDTLPGVPVQNLGVQEQTVQLSPDELNNHFEEMKEQLVLKPASDPSLIDGLDDMTVSGHDIVPSIDEVRTAASALEQDLVDPNAKIDENVAESFARLEQSAQEAAYEKDALVQPADTVITTSPMADYRLTSEEIFGGLIADIELGKGPKMAPGAGGDPVESTAPDQEPSFASIGGDTNPNQNPPEEELVHSPDRTDKYELIDLINEDQAFEIWKAKIKGEKGFERIFALKKIKSYLADNFALNTLFLKEAQLAAALSHPNIVQIYELGEFEGARFLAREYLVGESLQSVFHRCRDKDATLPAGVTAYLGLKIAEALSYAHTVRGLDGSPLNIVHHHLSPDNIIITDEGELKVLNFGTGQVAAQAAGHDMVPLEQLQSLAPEQVAGESLDHRVDIFALGSMLYRALTGLDPFAGTGRESVMTSIKAAKSTAVNLVRPDIPTNLSDIVAKAMQGNMSLRYSSAKELARDLRDFLKKSGQRIGDEDLASYLRALRAGIVMEAPSALPSAKKGNQAFPPPPDPVTPTPQPAVAPPPASGPEELPPVRRVRPPQQPVGADGGDSNKGLVAAIVILLLVLVGVLAWKFYPKSSAPTPAPATSVPAPTTPAPDEQPDLSGDTGTDETPLEDAAAATDEEAGEPDAAPVEGIPSETEAPTTVEAAPTETAQPVPAEGEEVKDPELEAMQEALRQKQEELKRKRELLKKLKDKDNQR